MRILPLSVIVFAGCATGHSGDTSVATTTSVVDIGGGGVATPKVIRVQAGVVRVIHSIPSGARLRATTLEGLDEANRHLRYEWTRNGEFTVELSGRYQHSVAGSIVGSGRLTSTLRYTSQPDGSELSSTCRPPVPHPAGAGGCYERVEAVRTGGRLNRLSSR